MKIFAFHLILGVFVLSCSPKKEMTSPVITKAIRAEADSLFNKNLDSLSLVLDQECSKRYQSHFERAKDSIKQQRLSEIEDIIDE